MRVPPADRHGVARTRSTLGDRKIRALTVMKNFVLIMRHMVPSEDPQFESFSDISDPASEVMQLIALMLAECPYPVMENDRRQTTDRRLRNTARALPRGEDRRAFL